MVQLLFNVIELSCIQPDGVAFCCLRHEGGGGVWQMQVVNSHVAVRLNDFSCSVAAGH